MSLIKGHPENQLKLTGPIIWWKDQKIKTVINDRLILSTKINPDPSIVK